MRRRIAVGCRILAHAGLCEDVLGHISVRVDDDTILVRSRGPRRARAAVHDRRRRRGRARSTAARSTRRRRRPAERAADPRRLLPRRPDGRAPSSTPTRRRSSPPTSPASRSCRWSVRTTSRRRALAAGGIAVYPRGVLINTDELGRGDGRGDGRPAGVRAARPRGDDDRRVDRAGRRPGARRRLAGPHGLPRRRARRHADGAAGRRPGASCPTSARRSTTSCSGVTTSSACEHGRPRSRRRDAVTRSSTTSSATIRRG